jgi:hypothetical protein
MANTFLTAPTIVAQALGLLERELVLPRLVSAFGARDFRGAQGDTLTLRVPAVLAARDYTWRTRPAAIVVDDLTELGVDVSLDAHIYSAVSITDEQLMLSIASFGDQVLRPQVRAVAERLENVIATTLAAAATNSIDFVEATDEPYDVAVDARRELNRANVPLADRFLVLGSDVEAAFLKSDKLSKVNESGADSALRDAVVGRVAGFTVLTSNAIDPDAAYALHRSAIAFANVAPAVPDGAGFGAAQSYGGLAMRWIKDYDAAWLRDRSVVSSFAGAASVSDGAATPTNVRIVGINFTPA